MFQKDNGRGVHPKIRQSSLIFWPMDGQVRRQSDDLLSIDAHLIDQNVNNWVPPMIIPGMIGGTALRFENSSEVTGTSAPQNNHLGAQGESSPFPVRNAFQTEATFGMWFRDRRPISATGIQQIYAFSGAGTDDLLVATNSLFTVRSDRDLAGERQKFTVFWEYGSGTDVLIPFDTTFERNRWIYVVFRKREIVAGAGTSGVIHLDLFLNGQLVETIYGNGTPTATSGTWTWDGSTTVLATDTTGVAVNDYVRKDSNSPFFRVTSVVANTSVTIDNPDALTIPSGTGAESRGPLYNNSNGEGSRHSWGARWNGTFTDADHYATFDVCGGYIWDGVLTAEEIEDDFRRGLLLPYYNKIDSSCDITGPSGEQNDLRDFWGMDWFESARVTDDVDRPAAEAQITLVREQENMSLAVLKTDTSPNLTSTTDPSSYNPAINVQRDIRLRIARVPTGIVADENDLYVRFSGKIDEVDWSGENVKIRARDLGGQLLDTYIEAERPYGAGATATLEATIQQILDDNDSTSNPGSYPDTTLFTPWDSQWVLNLQDGDPVQQLYVRREPVLTHLRVLAGQIGFDCRYRYDNDPDQQQQRLTLYEPERDRLEQDIILRAGEVLSVSNAKITSQRVRNVVRIVYPTSESANTTPTTAIESPYTDSYENFGPDGNGFRTVAYYEATNPDSYTLYGRKFMEVQERGSSQIDSIDEAQRMAVAMLKDLEEPEFEHSVTTIALPEMDPGDMVKFGRNEQLYTGQQRLALLSVTHQISDKPQTQIGLRGKPSVGFRRWLAMETRPGVPQSGAPPVIVPTESLTDAQRGSLLQFVTGLIDRTNYFKGGKFLAIRNPDFSAYTLGLGNPPDGWRVISGSSDWNTAGFGTSTTSQSGAYSVEMGAADPDGLETDYLIEVQGDTNQPYSFELTQRRSTSVGDSVEMEIDWIQSNRTSITQTTTLSSGGGFQTLPADTDWHTLRAEGIHVPNTNVRYARLRVQGEATGNGSSNGLVDHVSAYKTARSTKLGLDNGTGPADGTWGVCASGQTRNQPFSVTGNSLLTDEYDYGNQFVDDTDATTTENGAHFLCRIPGIYDVLLDAWVVSVATATKTWEWQLVLNGVYDGSTNPGTRTSGTVLAVERHTFTFTGTAPDQPQRIVHQVALDEGDRLTIDLDYVSGGAGTLALAAGLSPNRPSIWTVKQRQND